MPASSARWMILIESAWSVFPHAPNIIVPRQSGLTLTPVRPRLRRERSSIAPDSMARLRHGGRRPQPVEQLELERHEPSLGQATISDAVDADRPPRDSFSVQACMPVDELHD